MNISDMNSSHHTVNASLISLASPDYSMFMKIKLFVNTIPTLITIIFFCSVPFSPVLNTITYQLPL